MNSGAAMTGNGKPRNTAGSTGKSLA